MPVYLKIMSFSHNALNAFVDFASRDLFFYHVVECAGMLPLSHLFVIKTEYNGLHNCLSINVRIIAQCFVSQRSVASKT